MKSVTYALSVFTLFFLHTSTAQEIYSSPSEGSQFVTPCFPLLPLPSFYLSAEQHMGSSLVSDSDYTRIGFSLVPDLSKYPVGVLSEGNLYLFGPDKWAVSIGGGLRFASPISEAIWGANLFWTYRDTDYKGLNQLTAGFEWITPCYEIFLNGYLPFGGEVFSNLIQFDYDGPYIVNAVQEELLFRGFDLSIGKYWDPICDIALYSRAGTYYIENKYGNSWGGLFQLEAWWKTYLYGGLLLTNDSIFETAVEGYVGVLISFDRICRIFSCCPPCEEGCDGWLRGRCGRSARVRQMGQAGIKQSCCLYETQNF